MSFFAHNLAVLETDAVSALPLRIEQVRNPCQATRIAIGGPREVSTMADQSLFVIGAKESLVVDSNCSTKQRMPKVSYLPSSRLLDEPRWPKAFALLDTGSGSLARYRWESSPKDSAGFFLPFLVQDDPNLKGSACALMRDGSLACVRGDQLYSGWPGHPTHSLGVIAQGADVVRLLPAERVDHVRVLRSDSLLEEYWLTSQLPRKRSFPLPEVAFDVVVGSGYLAVLQVESDTAGATTLRLVVLEPDGTLRWSLPVGHVASNQSEQRRHRLFFECLSLIAHQLRPYVALRTCDRISLFDARNGEILERIERAAP